MDAIKFLRVLIGLAAGTAFAMVAYAIVRHFIIFLFT